MFKKSNVGDQLLIAVKLNKISEISRLVALGVNVDSRIDKNGKTALHYAAYKGQLLAVKALIEAGADLDLTDENGVTALHRAIIHGHTDIVHTLLGAGCSVDKIDENGNTALHEAAWNGYSKCAELLVAAKCNVNIHNRTGYTSLHLAAQNCHCTTLRVLLDGGCNPLVKNSYGDTPLHIAVRYGHVEVCNMLMETKMNISEQNNDGNTPLHIAASMGHEKLTEMLLKAGIATTEKNNVGDTARELAVRNGFKKIAKLLAPTRGDTLRMFSRKERKEKRRPHSADVSHLFSGTTDSTLTTTATQLWIPKPLSLDPDSKKEGHKRDFSSHRTWGRKRKDERKPKVLTIKYDEMCSIERDYIKRRNSSTRKSHKSHSRSSLKSQEEKVRSDPVLHHKSKKFHSLVKVDEKVKSAQSRDDLEVTLSPKKTKKDRGFFALFRSASDTDLNAGEQKNGVFGKKHKDKYPPAGEVMGNGYHHVGKEVKEKGETEETKEKKDKRKGDEKTEKKDRTSKKSREEEKEKLEKKERRKEKEKEKKQSRRDEKDGSESDCTICQEKRRKSHSKETKQKEHRSKSEHRRPKDHKETDLKDKHDKTPADKRDEEKEHKKKKHHRDKERERDDHRDKDRERDHRDKEREKDHREKDRSRRDKNHKRKNEEHAVDLGQTPCNQTHCSTCEAQLSRLEAWQERCTSEIDSARRRLEHRLQRLEKKLEVQLSEERQLKDKESRDKEYDRVVGRVKDECREVSKNVQDSSGNVKEEIRGLIKGGLSKLELKLGQISRGYNIPFMDCQHRCNPELGRNCSVERGIRHVRSRSSPHLGRAPCEDCVQVLEHRAGGASPHLASFTPSENSSRATSGIRVSDSGSLDTVIEARPVGDKALHASGTIIEARPVDDEGLDTVIEAQPVVEDESVVKINDTYAATQVQHQRQVQEVEKWWRAKAEEEQRVLYARICELEQMLMMSRAGGDCFV